MEKEVFKFRHTKIASEILALDKIYKKLDIAENKWKTACHIRCIDGCGSCCIHFEPDIYKIEALYLAAGLLYHDGQRALEISQNKFQPNVIDYQNGCLLFDIDNPNHCTVYGGRTFICRLFGYSGDRNKYRKVRWRPCKYLNDTTKLSESNTIKQMSET